MSEDKFKEFFKELMGDYIGDWAADTVVENIPDEDKIVAKDMYLQAIQKYPSDEQVSVAYALTKLAMVKKNQLEKDVEFKNLLSQFSKEDIEAIGMDVLRENIGGKTSDNTDESIKCLYSLPEVIVDRTLPHLMKLSKEYIKVEAFIIDKMNNGEDIEAYPEFLLLSGKESACHYAQNICQNEFENKIMDENKAREQFILIGHTVDVNKFIHSLEVLNEESKLSGNVMENIAKIIPNYRNLSEKERKNIVDIVDLYPELSFVAHCSLQSENKMVSSANDFRKVLENKSLIKIADEMRSMVEDVVRQNHPVNSQILDSVRKEVVENKKIMDISAIYKSKGIQNG